MRHGTTKRATNIKPCSFHALQRGILDGYESHFQGAHIHLHFWAGTIDHVPLSQMRERLVVFPRPTAMKISCTVASSGPVFEGHGTTAPRLTISKTRPSFQTICSGESSWSISTFTSIALRSNGSIFACPSCISQALAKINRANEESES